MAFLLRRRTAGGDADPIRDREAMGEDIRSRTVNTLLPSTVPVAGSSRTPRIIESTVRLAPPRTPPPREPDPQPIPQDAPVPGGPAIQPEAPVTFIPAPNSGLTLGGPTVPGGSGPTFPIPGGFQPQGGSGIGDTLSGALGGLINRGVQELGDALFGGPEAPGTGQAIPGQTFAGGECPGATSVKIGGRCVNLGDLGPGGPPAVTGTVPATNGAAGFGQAVRGMYGPGVIPRVEARTVRKCPKGMVLGDDGVCYKGLARTRRMWDPGMKPLMTGGDRAAIRRAERAANKLKRAKKKLRKASKALDKAC